MPGAPNRTPERLLRESPACGVSGSGSQVEIARVEEVKRAMMKELVGEVRDQLAAVWEEMRYSDAEKQFFRPYHEQVCVCVCVCQREKRGEASERCGFIRADGEGLGYGMTRRVREQVSQVFTEEALRLH